MNRVAVKSDLLRWARQRAGNSVSALARKFPKLPQWENGEKRPTLKQLESFAKFNYVPVGYLFLHEPPVETVPIPDLRTFGNRPFGSPSPNLLDSIYLCQRRQAWYREWARSVGEEPYAFIGSASVDSNIVETAADMRRKLCFELDARSDCPTWTEALRLFIARADDMGVLVMISGVVGNNNTRKLNPVEFRGFTLADDLAPLVFINGADTKAAQIFTLAHELAHLWLGESALTDTSPSSVPTQRIESWCNQVAAELLVPLAALREALPGGDALTEVPILARRFKVSTLVILRRMLDARCISRESFLEAYDLELKRLLARPKTSGGDFYLTQAARLSKRFAMALIGSTLEGQTLYRDAFRMLGIKKEATFRELGASLGYLL